MTGAKDFYKANVKKQREILENRIQEAKDSGDPIIMLPFDTYPVVEQEMAESGYEYDSYRDKNNKKCAMFYPKEYKYSYNE